MSMFLVSLLFGFCAGFLGFLIGQDVEQGRQERARHRARLERYMQTRRP